MKKPLPRPLPVSIDATAGSAALTTSSIDPADIGTPLPDPDGGGVNTTRPSTGATNVSDACAMDCGDSVVVVVFPLPLAGVAGASDGTRFVRASIGAGALVCTT